MGSWVASACVAQPWWLVWTTQPDPSWIPDGGWPMPRSGGARPQPGQGPVLARHCHLPAGLNTTAQVPGCTLSWGLTRLTAPAGGGGGHSQSPQGSTESHHQTRLRASLLILSHGTGWQEKLRKIEYQGGWIGSPVDLDPSSTPIPGASRHTAREGGAPVSPGTGQQPCGAWAGMAISASGRPRSPLLCRPNPMGSLQRRVEGWSPTSGVGHERPRPAATPAGDTSSEPCKAGSELNERYALGRTHRPASKLAGPGWAPLWAFGGVCPWVGRGASTPGPRD